MQLSKFWVKGYGTFSKGAEFDLDYKGITTVFGLNKDAGGSSYTNASGKSLLFTAVPEIAFGCPPSGKDQTKHPKTEIGLEFKDADKGVLTFTKTYGKSKKFTVCKNGKDINVRKLDYAQKKLQSLLGGSEEDFYTTRYIDNTIPHPLIVGSAAKRQDFFVSMFKLGNVDAMRHLLLAELREVQKVSATYKEVKAMFDDLKGKALKQSEIESLRERIDRLTGKQERILSQIKKYQVVRDLMRFESQNKSLIEEFHKRTSLAKFESEMFNVKQKISSLKERRVAAQEWEVYSRLRKTYVETSKPLLKRIHDLVGENYSRKELRSDSEACADYEKRVKDATQELNSLVLDKPDKVAPSDIDPEKTKAKVYRLQDELDHARSFKEGKCPTCGAPHKTRKVADIKADRDESKAQLAAYEAYADYKLAKTKYRDNVERKAVLDTRIDKWSKLIRKLRSSVEAWQLLEKMPTKPNKPQGEPLDLQEVEAGLEDFRKRKERLDRFKDVLEQIRELSKLTPDQRAKAKELDSFTDDLGRISNKLNILTAQFTSGQEATKQLKGLATRGKALAKQAEDEPVLKALIEAYSKKGLKKLLIQRYASLLQQQVNKFVRLFFAEDLQFEFHYGSKLDVLVHRKKGKKVITTDVKRLSGAEKRMLTLVLVVASISLLPKKQRSNYLILDEPEANLGPEAVATFVKALPILNKVIPHIVVITPRPELEISGSRVFTVVKKGGVSTLVKGKV